MDTSTGRIIEFPEGINPDINRYKSLPIGHVEIIAKWPCRLTEVDIENQRLVFVPLSRDEKYIREMRELEAAAKEATENQHIPPEKTRLPKNDYLKR